MNCLLIWATLARLALAQPDLLQLTESRCLETLRVPAEVRLVAANRPAFDGVTPGAGSWKYQVLSPWQAAAPRVRMEYEIGGVRRSWVMVFRREVQVRVWCARIPLAVGTPLRQEDFEEQCLWQPASAPQPATWQFGPLAGGFRLRQCLGRGARLEPGKLEPIPLCEAGCSIVLVFRREDVRILLGARALERGYPGRSLRVRLDSGKTVLAFCSPEGEFQIQEGIAR